MLEFIIALIMVAVLWFTATEYQDTYSIVAHAVPYLMWATIALAVITVIVIGITILKKVFK